VTDSVNIRKIKEKCGKINSQLRTLILSEPDYMTQEEYLAKSETWLKILELDEEQ